MKQQFICAACLVAAVTTASADEGLWLVNAFPKSAVEKKYKSKITDDFLKRLQMASVRFNNGGSGSFVSGDGLLFTNHHVGSDCIQKLSSEKHNYMANGFYAATRAEEKACPDLEVNVLQRIEDVTAKVKAGTTDSTPPADAFKTRKANTARIEKECGAATGLRCDVVTLYSGAKYDLYHYKKWTDVRLVFAPEEAIAFFGGDPDNFTFPRYDLDIAFFRAYENGKPAKVEAYFPWSKQGAKDGELVFVSGHPGKTDRLDTVAELEFYRDFSYPHAEKRLRTLIDDLLRFSEKSEEDKRVARDALFSLQNSLKARIGFLGGLTDPALIAHKKDDERKLRAAINDDPAKRKLYADAWDEVASAFQEYRKFYDPYIMFERGALASDLFGIARDVYRYPFEKAKPNGERLKEFTDSSLPETEQSMFSPAPITGSLQATLLARHFHFMIEHLGANDPVVKEVLAGQSPEQAAQNYVSSSKLKDVAERKRLAASVDAVKSSDDGMIRLMRILEKPGRKYREMWEHKVEAVLTSSAAKVAQARFAVYGGNDYPDATFTLRVSYAVVKGYTSADGKPVSWATDLGGAFKHATGKEPFELPPSWLKAQSKLNSKTPFNFVTTADTHGGNSGSPTLNARGELVGILFDGNIESLPNQFVYSDARARSVHVASQGIVEALRKVYSAGALLKELGF